MFLKRIINKKIIKLFLFFFTLYISSPGNSKQDEYLNNVFEYLDKINEFSSSFLQIENNDISEGLLSIKNKRLRIEYISPTKLVFVLKENKAMFFNIELQEVQYFNPQNTAGQFFLDLFNNQNFLLDAKVINENSYFYLLKNIYVDDNLNEVEVYFEKSPFHLKKIRIINNDSVISFTIINPNFNPNLNDKIFSLANPLLGS